jgi:hypothetical protein
MPSLSDIATAGPWAVCVFFLAAGIVGLFLSVVSGRLVPGWIYRKLDADWEQLKDQGDRSSKTMEAVPPLVAGMARIEEKLDTLLRDREYDRHSPRGR